MNMKYIAVGAVAVCATLAGLAAKVVVERRRRDQSYLTKLKNELIEIYESIEDKIDITDNVLTVKDKYTVTVDLEKNHTTFYGTQGKACLVFSIDYLTSDDFKDTHALNIVRWVKGERQWLS